MRRPRTVDWLRSEGSRFLADALDQDPEIREAMAGEGLSETPSRWFEQEDLGEQLSIGLREIKELFCGYP